MEITRRFYKNIIFKECWEWKGSTGSSGYGRFQIDGKQWLAHRFSYSLFIDDIPENLVIDHLCRNKICVNPSHLEVVEHGENTRRGEAGQITGGRQSAKTHCPKGHAYIGRNVMQFGRSRYCRTCGNERSREYQRKKRSNI
jgi:hypothetical protein